MTAAAATAAVTVAVAPFATIIIATTGMETLDRKRLGKHVSGPAPWASRAPAWEGLNSPVFANRRLGLFANDIART